MLVLPLLHPTPPPSPPPPLILRRPPPTLRVPGDSGREGWRAIPSITLLQIATTDLGKSYMVPSQSDQDI